MNPTPGILYLIGTPIGNLEDITLRALRALRDVDLIAAEDTRVTRVLLQHYKIETRMISYHEHSGLRRLEEIMAALRSGKDIAFVSDAGMPGISDPGAKLVGACADAGISAVVVPGPAAASAALALSGLPAKEFLFLGFLPSRGGPRREVLRRVVGQPGALILFEAPHRLRESLEAMAQVLGDRRAACCRELTKHFEEVVRGTISELMTHFSQVEPRGEFTIVIEGVKTRSVPGDVDAAGEEVAELIAAGLSPSRAVTHVAKARRVSKSALYRAVVTQRRGDEA